MEGVFDIRLIKDFAFRRFKIHETPLYEKRHETPLYEER